MSSSKFSQLSLLPDADAWIMDPEYEQGNIQEINFKNLDEIPSDLEDLLKVVRAKEYSNYENSFVGQKWSGRLGVATQPSASG